MGSKCFKVFVKEVLERKDFSLLEWGIYIKMMSILSDSPLPGMAYFKSGEPITDESWSYLFALAMEDWKKIKKKLLTNKLFALSKENVIFKPGFNRYKTYKINTETLLERKKKKLQKKVSKYFINPVDVYEIFAYYKKVLNRETRSTEECRFKIRKRLRDFTKHELKQAVDNAKTDTFFIENNLIRGATWFFKSNERIEHFLNIYNIKRRRESLRKLQDKEADRMLKDYEKNVLDGKYDFVPGLLKQTKEKLNAKEDI